MCFGAHVIVEWDSMRKELLDNEGKPKCNNLTKCSGFKRVCSLHQLPYLMLGGCANEYVQCWPQFVV